MLGLYRGLLLAASSGLVSGFIPLSASNDTSDLPNTDTSDSTILLRWTDEGNYHEGISRRQVNGLGSTGIEKGALVHFFENTTANDWDTPTNTPWIAFINCDRNTTDASQELDVFTIVQGLGAVASLLYSTTSETCVINPAYAKPEFQPILDIYTTITRSSARLIESQFSNINKTDYYFYNGPRMNDSNADIQSAIGGNGVEPGYLIATVKLTNVTDPIPGTDNGGGNGSPSKGNNDDDDQTKTGLAMIILYAITGCVSALFCVVIITGAIRAFRHPERYGPRRGDPQVDGFAGAPQTRAAGLTRAILDTFPVIKFAAGSSATSHSPGNNPLPASIKDLGSHEDRESAEHAMSSHEVSDQYEMSPTSRTKRESEMIFEHAASRDVDTTVSTTDPSSSRPSSSRDFARMSAIGSPLAANQSAKVEPTPENIGTDICPICISEFEEGDDLRVLPCEGQHKFHRDCVDPWLLQVSSQCPLCRQDFLALEHMAMGVPPGSDPSSGPRGQHISGDDARFNRYIRTVQQQNYRNQPIPDHAEALFRAMA